MYMDNRRNLDFAFPAFAPGLPSVYERAGFDIKQPSRSAGTSLKSSSRSQRAPESSPAPGTPYSLNSNKFEQQPPLPDQLVKNNSTPRVAAVPPPSARSLSGGAFSSTPNFSTQEIPPRAASRRPTLPLSTNKPALVSKESSGSRHSSRSSYSHTYSGGSDTTHSSTDTGATGSSNLMEFSFKQEENDQFSSAKGWEHDNAQTDRLAAPTFNNDRFSTTSSIYSSADPRRSEIMPTRKEHPTLEIIPSIGPICPYPVSATPEPETPVEDLPSMPPKAPDHAKRVSHIKKGTDVSIPSSLHASQIKSITKNVCRECSLDIIGKSVYSKDGMMSGHWHRACFVCTDCKSPLSSEVYVLSDSPHCNACYHQSNKSICKSCGEGIEGLCLEGIGQDGEDIMRYHPSCLECAQCSVQLSDVYYETGGLTYCEKHGANAKQARRRTTRLLMSS